MYTLGRPDSQHPIALSLSTISLVLISFQGAGLSLPMWGSKQDWVLEGDSHAPDIPDYFNS